MTKRELSLPTGATEGPHQEEALEMLRAWWVHDKPEFVLSPILADPGNVGRVLYEAAFHFSQVYAAHGLGEADDLLGKIKYGWENAQQYHLATVMTKPGEKADGKSEKN